MPTSHHVPASNGTEQPRAVGYIRVSTKKQAGKDLNGEPDKDGPERQRRAIEAFAEANGYRIVGWFQDAITGTTEHREDFARMLEALKAGAAKVVIVERMDRLARRMITGEMCADDIRREGATLYDCAGNDLTEADDGDPDKVLVRQILGAIAQHAKSIAVLRMRAARERARAAGERCEGQPPFGFHDNEKPALARMVELWLTGLPVHKVTEQLNREQILTRRGFLWARNGVDRVLQRARKDDPTLEGRRQRTEQAVNGSG